MHWYFYAAWGAITLAAVLFPIWWVKSGRDGS